MPLWFDDFSLLSHLSPLKAFENVVKGMFLTVHPTGATTRVSEGSSRPLFGEVPCIKERRMLYTFCLCPSLLPSLLFPVFTFLFF